MIGEDCMIQWVIISIRHFRYAYTLHYIHTIREEVLIAHFSGGTHITFFVLFIFWFILYFKIPSDTFTESCRLFLYVYKQILSVCSLNLFMFIFNVHRININVRKKKVKQQIIQTLHRLMLELFELVIIFFVKHLELEVLEKLKVLFFFN